MKGGVFGGGSLEIHAAGCGARDARVVPRLRRLYLCRAGGFNCAVWRWVFRSVSGNVHVTVTIVSVPMLIVLFVGVGVKS